MDRERQLVLVELLVLNGNTKEYRRRICHKTRLGLVRRSLAKGSVVIGSCVSDIDTLSDVE